MSVFTILMGTLLYTWIKSREAPPPSDSKELSLPMTNTHKMETTSKLLEHNGDPSNERSKSDSGEIFATGAHDFDEEANIQTRKPLS
jgi:hypothetical protein